MTVDKTEPAQSTSISFELDLLHAPEKVWRALTDPELLAEWLLPVIDLELEPGAAFTLKTQPYPGWDGTVNCRFVEIEDGQEPLGEQRGVGERAPHLLRRVLQVPLERKRLGLRWGGLVAQGHGSIFASSRSRRRVRSVQKAR